MVILGGRPRHFTMRFTRTVTRRRLSWPAQTRDTGDAAAGFATIIGIKGENGTDAFNEFFVFGKTTSWVDDSV